MTMFMEMEVSSSHDQFDPLATHRDQVGHDRIDQNASSRSDGTDHQDEENQCVLQNTATDPRTNATASASTSKQTKNHEFDGFDADSAAGLCKTPTKSYETAGGGDNTTIFTGLSTKASNDNTTYCTNGDVGTTPGNHTAYTAAGTTPGNQTSFTYSTNATATTYGGGGGDDNTTQAGGGGGGIMGGAFHWFGPKGKQQQQQSRRGGRVNSTVAKRSYTEDEEDYVDDNTTVAEEYYYEDEDDAFDFMKKLYDKTVDGTCRGGGGVGAAVSGEGTGGGIGPLSFGNFDYSTYYDNTTGTGNNVATTPSGAATAGIACMSIDDQLDLFTHCRSLAFLSFFQEGGFHNNRDSVGHQGDNNQSTDYNNMNNSHHDLELHPMSPESAISDEDVPSSPHPVIHAAYTVPAFCEYCGAKSTKDCDPKVCRRPRLYLQKKRPPFSKPDPSKWDPITDHAIMKPKVDCSSMTSSFQQDQRRKQEQQQQRHYNRPISRLQDRLEPSRDNCPALVHGSEVPPPPPPPPPTTTSLLIHGKFVHTTPSLADPSYHDADGAPPAVLADDTDSTTSSQRLRDEKGDGDDKGQPKNQEQPTFSRLGLVV